MRKPSDLTQFLKFVEMCFQFWGHVVTLSPPMVVAAQEPD